MIPLAKLLEPISVDKPCGDNLSYDPAFLDLQNKIRGKEETQFSAAEEPNWKEVLALAVELSGRFKHLQGGIILSAALLQTEGLTGFAEGLKVLSGWVEKYWESIYPQLDPEDNNDPTERINLLQCLSVTTQGDPYRFCDRLSHTPLCESKTLGRFDLSQVQAGKGGAGANTGAKPGIDAAQAAAAFRDTDRELVQKRYDAANESLASLQTMGSLLDKLVGAGRAPNLESLKKSLALIRDILAPYVASPPAGAIEKTVSLGSGPAALNEVGTVLEATGAGLADGINSRADVLAALAAVCAYYQRREPSSPVPFLLQRAQRLVPMDFLQIMGDLAPDALAQIKVVTGTTEDKAEKV